MKSYIFLFIEYSITIKFFFFLIPGAEMYIIVGYNLIFKGHVIVYSKLHYP